ADPRAGLRLERGGRPVRVEPEQEGPVATAPLEVVSAAVAFGVPEVVLSGRDLCGELSVVAIDDLVLCGADQSGQAGERLRCGDVRDLAGVDGAAVLAPAGVGGLGELELLAVPPADDEH